MLLAVNEISGKVFSFLRRSDGDEGILTTLVSIRTFVGITYFLKQIFDQRLMIKYRNKIDVIFIENCDAVRKLRNFEANQVLNELDARYLYPLSNFLLLWSLLYASVSFYFSHHVALVWRANGSFVALFPLWTFTFYCVSFSWIRIIITYSFVVFKPQAIQKKNHSW